VHCHAHRLALASYDTAADLYSIVRTKLQKHFNAIMEVFFDVAIGRLGDAASYNEDKSLAVAARMHNKGWLFSEATVRARCEILGIWAALKQLPENKNDAKCVVLLRLMKTKYFNMLLSFCQRWHFT